MSYALKGKEDRQIDGQTQTADMRCPLRGFQILKGVRTGGDNSSKQV